ncbi:hypothetical protein [Methylobacterium sp. 10]|uniref:hypothetical protein n=1 Tax=Methylobacterium sp. 10 TaxID=1101191 RepID=UPI0004AE1F07|nr:hypothetical protein [Methylobacterium sp. 10]
MPSYFICKLEQFTKLSRDDRQALESVTGKQLDVYILRDMDHSRLQCPAEDIAVQPELPSPRPRRWSLRCRRIGVMPIRSSLKRAVELR